MFDTELQPESDDNPRLVEAADLTPTDAIADPSPGQAPVSDAPAASVADVGLDDGPAMLPGASLAFGLSFA